MTRGYNHCVFVGYAARNASLSHPKAGLKLARFAIAVQRRPEYYKDSKVIPCDFINCQAWDELAEICHELVKKGALILVEGEYHVNNYRCKNRNERRKAYVIDLCRVNLLDPLPKDKPVTFANDAEIEGMEAADVGDFFW